MKDEIYYTVPIEGELVGGHFAAKCHIDQKIIGSEFKLDRLKADILTKELNTAYSNGRKDERLAGLNHGLTVFRGHSDGQRKQI